MVDSSDDTDPDPERWRPVRHAGSEWARATNEAGSRPEAGGGGPRFVVTDKSDKCAHERMGSLGAPAADIMIRLAPVGHAF